MPRRVHDAAVPAAPPRQNAVIHKDDVTMTVETVTGIEEIRGVVEVVVVVDKSIGTKTKGRPVSPVSSLT